MRRITAFRAVALLCVTPALLAIGVSTAFAQDVVIRPLTFMDQVWSVVAPAIVLVAGALATWLSAKLVSFLNIKDENERKNLEMKTRDVLHAAMLAGMKAALAKAGVTPTMEGVIPQKVIEDAIGYVKEKNPDTLAETGIDDHGLREIALSKIPDIIGQIAGGVGGPLVGNIAGAVVKGVAEAVARGDAKPVEPGSQNYSR